MKKKRKQILAVLISCSMFLFMLPASAADKNDSDYATRGEVVQRLLTAADYYSPGLEENVIIQGYEDGALRQEQKVSRAECFVMISRAFGDLPEPKGHDRRVGLMNLDFTGVPDWAATDVENLVGGGILVGTENGDLMADEFVTPEQLEVMLQRIWQLFGSNVKDDFYSTVNKEVLDNSVIADGEQSESAQAVMGRRNSEKVASLIEDALSQEQETGTPQQKIADYYSSAADTEMRDKAGVHPIQIYLDALEQANTLDDVFKVHNQIVKELGTATLLGFTVMQDAKDAGQMIPVLASVAPSLSQMLYAQESGEVQTAYQEMLTKYLTYLGEEESAAKKHAEQIYQMEARIAEKQLSLQDQYNIEKRYNPMSFEELKKLCPEVDLEKLADAFGMSTEQEKVNVIDIGQLKAFCQQLTEENVEILKSYLKIGLVTELGGTLDSRFANAQWEFSKRYEGVQGEYDAESEAFSDTISALSTEMEEAYAKKYCSEQIKNDVTGIIKEYLEIYRSRIQELSWMSDATKQKALKKLDTMKLNVGYPDEFNSVLEGVQILGPSEMDNTYFKNKCAVNLARQNEEIASLSKPANRDKWVHSVFQAGAAYMPQNNSINFPAGFLQEPYYDPDASRETNLGGVGVVIGHEITHAFDNSGSKFDENGNAVNWWSDEDRAAFEALCEKMVEYYDGYEIAPGIALNGRQTLGENIADTGGIGCSLEVLSRMEKPDYDAFFRNFARGSYFTAERQGMELVVNTDVHSRAKGRVNHPIACYDEFYETYKIQPGDGMYVAPEDRVRIW